MHVISQSHYIFMYLFTFTSEVRGGGGGETGRKFQNWTPRLEKFYRNFFSHHRQLIIEGHSGSGGTAGVVAETHCGVGQGPGGGDTDDPQRNEGWWQRCRRLGVGW